MYCKYNIFFNMITPKYVFSVDIERKDIRTRKKVYSEVG